MLPDLESLRCFVEAARLLNFRAASKTIGLTPAALGQRIRKLETQLEVSLFQRTTRRVVLTEAGLALLPEALSTLEAAENCVRAARGRLGPIAMDLVIGTRHELGLSWLVPSLPTLRAAHQGVTFHLYFGSGADLELKVRTQEIDCAVSSRRLSDPSLDFVRLHPEHYAFVGSPRLLEEIPFDTLDRSEDHVLIDTAPELPLLRYWRDGCPEGDKLSFKKILVMGTAQAIETLVLDGEGVAVLPLYMIRHHLDRGDLVEIFPDIEPKTDAFRLIFRTDDPRRSIFSSLAETLLQEPLR